VAENSGIDLIRRRMERASRQPPPPRHPAGEREEAPAADPAPADPAPAEETRAEESPPVFEPTTPVAPRPPSRRARRAPAPARLAPDLPPVNLAIRVRKPLDDRLADLIHALRRRGVRTSKVELIEMLLWELPEGEEERLLERLRGFRRYAPRGAAAPLEEESPRP
jgi:hypothetical protein